MIPSQDPKTAGIDAFRAGHPTSACGYADGSSQKLSWLSGWTQEQIAQRADRNLEAAGGTSLSD